MYRPIDARSVAVVALRTPGLRQIQADDTTVTLRLLVDRGPARAHPHRGGLPADHLLLELVPGGAKQFLSAQQARALLATVRPRDVVGKTRRWLASEVIHELAIVDKKINVGNVELTDLVANIGSRLQELHGIGPSGAEAWLTKIARV